MDINVGEDSTHNLGLPLEPQAEKTVDMEKKSKLESHIENKINQDEFIRKLKSQVWETKQSKSPYYIPNFDFLRLFKDHFQLFTILGVFGAIAVYLNSLIPLPNTNLPSTSKTLIGTFLIYVTDVINYLQNTDFRSIIHTMLIEPYMFVNIEMPSEIREAYVNIAVVASLVIFLVIGISIWKIYKTKYESLNSNLYDMFIGPSFIVLLLIVSAYIFTKLISYSYMWVIIFILISQYLSHVTSTIYKIYSDVENINKTKISTYMFYFIHTITFCVSYLMLLLLLGVQLNANQKSSIELLFIINIMLTTLYVLYNVLFDINIKEKLLENSDLWKKLFINNIKSHNVKESCDTNNNELDENKSNNDNDLIVTGIISFLFCIFAIIMNCEQILKSQLGVYILPLMLITYITLPIIVDKFTTNNIKLI